LDTLRTPKSRCSELIRTLPLIFVVPTETVGSYGLSLSYDIVKADGGELKVETKEGERAEFIIRLPNNTKP
jgi:hypothetical protein